MPINFTHPATSQLRVDYASAVRNGFTALSQLLDPAVAGTLTGTPTGAYRVKSADSGALERFNGTSWVAQPVNGLNYSAGQVAIGNNLFGGSRLTVSGPIGNNTLSINSVALPSAAGQRIGVMGFGVDGETAIAQARISAFSEGTWTTNTSSPAYLSFSTTAVGSASAAERMRLDSIGNLGIGLTPSFRLHVSGAGNQIVATDATHSIVFGVSSSTTYIGSTTAAPLRLLTNAAERFRIDASGNSAFGVTPLASVPLMIHTGASRNVAMLDQGSVATITAVTDAGSSAALRVVGNGLTFSGNGSTNHITVSSAGFFSPVANNAQDIGADALRWANVKSVLGNYSGALTALSFDSAASTDLLLRPAGTLRGTLSQAGALTLTAQPGFSAYTLSAFTVGTGGSFTDVIYGTEDYDHGNCYDASTGVFTAPVDGKYLVMFSICPQWVAGAITDVFQALMLKNGASMGGRANCFIPRPGATSTTQIDRPWEYTNVVTLVAGDTLKWRASHGGASTLCSGLSATFSATLLH